jgi:hypothetical protein
MALQVVRCSDLSASEMLIQFLLARNVNATHMWEEKRAISDPIKRQERNGTTSSKHGVKACLTQDMKT